MKKALVVFFEDFEEIEALCPVDILRRAGVDVLTASLDGEALVRGRSGVSVKTDTTFSDRADEDFDAVIIPGGAGVLRAAKNEGLLKFVRRHFDAGRLVGAICAAPVLLHAAGVLEGKNFTSHFSVADSLPGGDLSKSVVRDGNLLTSRGAGTALDFALALVESMNGADCAREIAKAIAK